MLEGEIRRFSITTGLQCSLSSRRQWPGLRAASRHAGGLEYSETEEMNQMLPRFQWSSSQASVLRHATDLRSQWQALLEFACARNGLPISDPGYRLLGVSHSLAWETCSE